jgi:hypothetical protein
MARDLRDGTVRPFPPELSGDQAADIIVTTTLPAFVRPAST